MNIDNVMKYLEKKIDSDSHMLTMLDGKEAIVSDWNKAPRKLQSLIEDAGYETYFDDEIDQCYDCGKGLLTRPQYYGWIPNFFRDGDGYPICEECWGSCYVDEYLEAYVDNAEKALFKWQIEKVKQEGWIAYECGYENGFHPGQTDDPKSILKKIQEEDPSLGVIFYIEDIGQFDMHFGVLVKSIYEVKEDE